MIRVRALIILSILAASFTSQSQDQSAFPPLEARYMGQKRPGLTPQPFAPGIIATEEFLESEVLFLPDMSELSFTRTGGKYKEPTWIVMQYKDNKWQEKPIPADEIKQYKEKFNPSVSKIKNQVPFKNIPIIGYTTSAAKTQYFYVLDFTDGSGHMSYSRFKNGAYEQAHKMSSAVNQGKYIAHPFIAPDESYLLRDAEKIDENTPDIYISFHKKDGSWSDAASLGKTINTPLYEQRAKISADGKYLFFWKGDVKTREDGSRYVVGSPYWVDAKIMEQFRPKKYIAFYKRVFFLLLDGAFGLITTVYTL